MGFLGDLWDAVEDVGETVYDAAADVVDVVGGVAEAAVGAVATVGAPVLDFAADLVSPVFGIGEALVSVVTDPMGAVDFLGDVITDPVGAVEGAFDSVVDYGLGIGEGLGGVIKGVGESAYDLGGDLLETGLGAVGSAGGLIGGAVGAAGGLVNAATGGLAEDALNWVDDEVFDRVDDWTQGVINIDYDDGNFSTQVGVDNLLDVGFGIGDDGITGTADVPLIGVDVGLTGSDGATVLLDENVPGVDLPFDAEIGLGVSADGGAGIVARLDEAPLDGITVNLVGDYDADLDYDQISGIARTAPAGGGAPGAGPVGPGDPSADVLARESFAPIDPAIPNDSFDTPVADDASALGMDTSFEPDPLPQTDFQQAIASSDEVESSLGGLFDDL